MGLAYNNICNGELGLNTVWNIVRGVSTLFDLMSQYPAKELLTVSQTRVLSVGT